MIYMQYAQKVEIVKFSIKIMGFFVAAAFIFIFGMQTMFYT